MILAAVLLLSPLPVVGNVRLPVANLPVKMAASSENKTDATVPKELLTAEKSSSGIALGEALPPMPEPKASSAALAVSVQPVEAMPAFAYQPVKSAVQRSYDSRNEKRMWYGLMIAGHAGAAFDAWTTRRDLSQNWGTESDPLMRPFAHSGALYAATQVSPLLTDLVSRKMMVSEHPMIRKFWWVPQSMSASMSFGAGIRNMGVTH
jgi:hypothetical protein